LANTEDEKNTESLTLLLGKIDSNGLGRLMREV
jgi:hypothetical protein